MNRIRYEERGQAFALTAISLVAMLAIAAFVLDVGSWFRADRNLQSVADAAALAGAQALPENPAGAVTLAEDYADKNGGPAPTNVAVSTTKGANDTITVEMEDEADGFFSQVVGIDAVDVGARAVARAALPGKARWVAPIVVNEKHPMLTCKPTPCFDTTTELEYYHIKTGGGKTEPDGAGSFGFIDLTGEGSGTSELKKQIANGYDQYLAPGTYTARTGNPFSAIQTDLDLRVGEEMLFPIYRTLTGTGTNAKYEIIGFVGFVITSMDLKGSSEKFYGYFTRVVWDAIEADSGSPPDFGVRTIVLTE
jgi:hypothetical protein